MSNRRVAVTGMGIVSCVGNDVDTAWKNVVDGNSGISTIDTFDTTGLTTTIAGLVRGFDPQDYMPAKEARKIDPFIRYGLAAVQQAIDASSYKIDASNAHRVAVAMGSGIGGLQTIEANHDRALKGGARKISPFFVPGSIINMISGHVSINFGITGPNIAMVTACSTGTHNIGFGARMIAYGDADMVIAGGAEHASTPLAMGGFCSARALSTNNDDPTGASRPWDQGRDGFVLSDGAACLVLEEYNHAVDRGAPIIGEILGFGMSSDAHHITAPPENGEGARQCMQSALDDAGLAPEQVDYVNATVLLHQWVTWQKPRLSVGRSATTSII